MPSSLNWDNRWRGSWGFVGLENYLIEIDHSINVRSRDFEKTLQLHFWTARRQLTLLEAHAGLGITMLDIISSNFCNISVIFASYYLADWFHPLLQWWKKYLQTFSHFNTNSVHKWKAARLFSLKGKYTSCRMLKILRN